MPKIIQRIVAGVVITCLTVDPSTAAAFVSHQPSSTVRCPSTGISYPFDHEALAPLALLVHRLPFKGSREDRLLAQRAVEKFRRLGAQFLGREISAVEHVDLKE